MTTTPVSLQDLRRRIYAKAKAEPHWRFWGLYVHVCKRETPRAAYAMAKANDGAPGGDGVTFETIEAQGVAGFLEQIRDELIRRSYVLLRARKKEIPKVGSTKVRTHSIPCIRDRVVQGVLRLIRRLTFDSICATPNRRTSLLRLNLAKTLVPGIRARSQRPPFSGKP